MRKQIVLSGIRATGKLHLGNYLGALIRFARMSQDPQYQCYFFVADLHTLTTLQDAALIKENLPDIILDYLAAGIDPNNAAIYVQSSIPQVTELAWYLACLAVANQLLDLPNFKDKKTKIEASGGTVNAGLLTYPILMAADILGPRADLVPVGKDQKPHLEFARHLARTFNRLYGDFFSIPDPMEEEMITVPGLSLYNADTEGFEKMGKSEGNSINLSDTPEESWEKIRVSPVDIQRQRRHDPGDPSRCAIFALHQQISSGEQIAWSQNGCQSAAIGCIDCKKVLTQNVNSALAEFRERRRKLAEKPGLIREVLMEGKCRAEPLFNQTIEVVRERMGLVRY